MWYFINFYAVFIGNCLLFCNFAKFYGKNENG